MQKQKIWLAACLVNFFVFGFAISPQPETTAQAAPPKTSAINVTTTIHDFDVAGSPLLTKSDDYNGVGQATYTTFKGKGANAPWVNSVIGSDGWTLSMNEQSGRAVWVTPNQPIDTSQPAAPPAGLYAIQKIFSICRDANGNAVTFQNLANGSGNCSLAINFSYGGILYTLRMRPGLLEGTTCPPGGCPPTGLAQVTCNAVSSNQCVNWTITPNAAAPLLGVSNLYSYTGPRGASWVFIGQYSNTFRINVSNLQSIDASESSVKSKCLYWKFARPVCGYLHERFALSPTFVRGLGPR